MLFRQSKARREVSMTELLSQTSKSLFLRSSAGIPRFARIHSKQSNKPSVNSAQKSATANRQSCTSSCRIVQNVSQDA